MREANRSLVLDLVKKGGKVSRSSIARSTTLAKPTVSAIVDELITEGLIQEVGVGVAAGGRPPILLQFNARSQLVVGTHVGARKTTIAVGDATGVELRRRELPTPQGCAEITLGIIADEIQDVLSEVQPQGLPVTAVGVVVPGLTDFHTGICMLAPNLGWHDVAVCEILSEKLGGVPVYVHNTGQAAAVAESVEGAGHGSGDLTLLYAGTGLSAGVICGGKIFHGVGGIAGEIGHCALPGLTEQCACGKIGCLETVASGRALMRVVHRAVEQGRTTVLAGHDYITGHDVTMAAVAGDSVAAEAISELAYYLGYAASWLVNMYSPPMLVIGGELSELGQPLLTSLWEAITEHCPAPAVRGVEIRLSKLGADAELRGAVLLALHHSEAKYKVVFGV